MDYMYVLERFLTEEIFVEQNYFVTMIKKTGPKGNKRGLEVNKQPFIL